MNITVVGFGHFAGVVAMCLAEKGHRVAQVDKHPRLMREGQRYAEDEPGFVPYAYQTYGADADVVWIAYDAPLDAHGAPVINRVLSRIDIYDMEFPPDVPFIVSCQWPVGTFAKLEERCPVRPFFYVLENVRVGKAIDDFRRQQTIVVGARGKAMPDLIDQLLQPFSDHTPFVMEPESAEMAKHATNAFMALQIAFSNEVAALCKAVGADAQDVMRGVLGDARVSPRAPLKPGAPFGGGSLKRDLLVLEALCSEHLVNAPIIEAINVSNEAEVIE